MTEFIVALLVALLGTIGAGVRRYIQTKLTPARIGVVLEFAKTAVSAAEKIGRAVEGVSGPDKYEYAEAALRDLSRRVGVKLTPTEANALIHAVLNEADEVEDLLKRRFEEVTADAA